VFYYLGGDNGKVFNETKQTSIGDIGSNDFIKQSRKLKYLGFFMRLFFQISKTHTHAPIVALLYLNRHIEVYGQAFFWIPSI